MNDNETYRITLREWRLKYYNGGKPPALITLKRRIDRGQLPGENASGEYVVFCDKNYSPINPNKQTGEKP